MFKFEAEVTASLVLRFIWVFLCINCPEDRAGAGTILTRRSGTAASLRLTRGSSWIWGIALNGVSAKIQPLRLIQPCRRYVETSDDVIEKVFT